MHVLTDESFPFQGKTMRNAVDDKAKECRVDKKLDAIVYDTTKSMTGNQIGTLMHDICCTNTKSEYYIFLLEIIHIHGASHFMG